MSTKHTPGPWAPVDQAVGAGLAVERPWTVQKPGQWYSTNGRVHRYATKTKAQAVADMLNLGESIREHRAAIAKAVQS